MPLQQTSGNLTTDAYGGGAATKGKYIEDFFVTWLRTGTGASATVTTGLDASANKALVWTKSRSAATDHKLTDTVRGATKALISDTTGAQTTDSTGLTAFSSTGYTIGADTNYNNSGKTYVDWEFIATPKFFDVVTYTGTGANRTIAHALGSTPGCIMVKRTDTTSNWQVYHNSLTSAAYSIQLNLTNAQTSAPTVWNSTAPTSTVFSVGTDATVNASGGTYVAYVFAHNAGGFGLTGTDNVISCGSYTGTAAVSNIVTLGYEPQWVLVKGATNTFDWYAMDVMRGMSNTDTAYLAPNTSAAESTFGAPALVPTATGFRIDSSGAGLNQSGATYIYIAIRRGPMKVPTDGTKVFSPIAAAFNSTTVNNNGFVTDMVITRQNRAAATDYQYLTDRLRGANNSSGQYLLETDGTYAETASSGRTALTGTQTIQTGFLYQTNTTNSIAWTFARAPGFFDEVCDTGTGSAHTVSHNLQAVPELIIRKSRSGATQWEVYSSALANTEKLVLNSTAAKATDATAWNSTTPTSSVFTVGTGSNVNTSTATYVTYLFASCPGVSKVGSYTGTGATQTISCGFTGGARFVLIKRTDTTGDWYVWDTARGMVSGTDPSLLLNSTAAEVNANSIYTTTGGFQIVSTAAGINASGGTYIFLAIA